MATYQLPDGNLVSDTMSFTWNGIQYPRNWIQLSTQEDRDGIGLAGPLPEPPWYDQNFYDGYDDKGNLIPKNHAELVKRYSEFCRKNANAILRETDWMVIREADTGEAVPQEVKTWRQDVRFAAGEKVTAIEATADTTELAAYITGAEYPVWPADPYAPTPLPSSTDGADFSSGSVATGF